MIDPNNPTPNYHRFNEKHAHEAAFAAGERERATFCFHCGASFGKERYPYCVECGTIWKRFLHGCPNDDSTWLHLYAPAIVELDPHQPLDQHAFVSLAHGMADCEFCDRLHLYEWTPGGITVTADNGATSTFPINAIQSAS